MIFTLSFAHYSTPGELLNATLSAEDGLGQAQDIYNQVKSRREKCVMEL